MHGLASRLGVPWFAWPLFGLLLTVPTVVSAQSTGVALMPLEGRRAGAARRQIGRALERAGHRVAMVDGASDDTAAVAESEDVDAVIGGRASRAGTERWRFQLWVRDRSGTVQAEVSLRGRGARGLGRAAAALHEALEQMTPGDDNPSPGRDEPSPAESAPQPSPRSSPVGPAQPRSRARSGPRSDAEPPPVQATFLVGAGLRSRRVEILSPDGVDGAYEVEPHVELSASAEARFFDVAFVRASFGSSIALESAREDPALAEVDTHFFRLRGDAGASVVIDDMVELGGAVGMGWDRYDFAFNELVPTAEYVHVRPAILSGIRLVGMALVLDVEVGVRIPLGVGDLQALHGVDYTVIGADGAARLGGTIEPGFSWALEASLRRYWLTFRRPDGDVQGWDGGWRASALVGWAI